jgi:hypothetical protein
MRTLMKKKSTSKNEEKNKKHTATQRRRTVSDGMAGTVRRLTALAR